MTSAGRTGDDQTGSSSRSSGDLKSALVEATLAQLEQVGVTGISLRGIAKSVGVSHMAPYNHFADRAALIAAAAAEGFGMLRAAMLARMQEYQPGDPRRFQAAGIAYAVFAVENPELFQLMFGPEVAEKHEHPELEQAAKAVQGTIAHGMAEAGMRSGGPKDDIVGLAPWALVHGLATLAVSRQLPALATDQMESLSRDLTYLLFIGLANWPPHGPELAGRETG